MDKNTIWAIVLSTLVIIGSYILLPIIFPSMAPALAPSAQTEQVEENIEITDLNTTDVISDESISEVSADAIENSNLEEEFITIKTNKAEVILTNKGGDIISYKLVGQKDTDTGDWIQISDSINEENRTCALAFGKSDSNIIQDIFTVDRIDDKTILFKKTFNLKGSKYTIGKKYTFKDDENVFKLDVLIHNEEGKPLDYNGVAYTLRTSPQIGPHFDPKLNRYENRQFVAYNGSKYKRVMLSSGQFKQYDKDFIWCGIAGKYFVELMIPSDSTIVGGGYYSSKVEKNNYANAQAFIERRASSNADVQDTYYMYFGPRNEKDLKRYNVAENNGWGLHGYKVNECLQTSGWLNWLEKILKWVLEKLNLIVRNWGVSIIIMTIILKILLFPLTKKQSLSSLKMQEIQPKIQAIQKKYANDQQKLQAETTKLYQEAGYNPASGCLPLVFQFLIIIAMYNMFNNYFEFRGASFIPKWIPDLSTGDSIFSWEKNIPLISGFTGNHFRLLPIIYVATQILQGWITQKSQPPAAGQSAATMKFMTYGMPLMFFFVFYNAPAGLLLYWLTSNILGIFQQILINKLMAEKKAEMANKNAKTTVNQKTLPPKNKRK